MSQINRLPSELYANVISFLNPQEQGALSQTSHLRALAQRDNSTREKEGYFNEMNCLQTASIYTCNAFSAEETNSVIKEVRRCTQLWASLRTSWEASPHTNPCLQASCAHHLEMDKPALQALAERTAHHHFTLDPTTQNLKYEMQITIKKPSPLHYLRDSFDEQLQSCQQGRLGPHEDHILQKTCYDLTRQGLYAEASAIANRIKGTEARLCAFKELFFTLGQNGETQRAIQMLDCLATESKANQVTFCELTLKGLLQATIPHQINDVNTIRHIVDILIKLKQIDIVGQKTSKLIIENTINMLLQRGYENVALQIAEELGKLGNQPASYAINTHIGMPDAPKSLNQNITSCIAYSICEALWRTGQEQQAIETAAQIRDSSTLEKFFHLITSEADLRELNHISELLALHSQGIAFHRQAIESLVDISLKLRRPDLAIKYLEKIPYFSQQTEARALVASYYLESGDIMGAAMQASYLCDNLLQSKIYHGIVELCIDQGQLEDAKSYALLIIEPALRNKSLAKIAIRILENSDDLPTQVANFIDYLRLITCPNERETLYSRFPQSVFSQLGRQNNADHHLIFMTDLVLREKDPIIRDHLLFNIGKFAKTMPGLPSDGERRIEYFANLITTDYLKQALLRLGYY